MVERVAAEAFALDPARVPIAPLDGYSGEENRMASGIYDIITVVAASEAPAWPE